MVLRVGGFPTLRENGNFSGTDFFLGGGNLRRSDFDYSKLFQS